MINKSKASGKSSPKAQAPDKAIKKDAGKSGKVPYISNWPKKDENEDDSSELITQDQKFARKDKYTFDDLVQFCIECGISPQEAKSVAKKAMAYGMQAVKAGATVPVDVSVYVALSKSPELGVARPRKQDIDRNR